MKKVRRETNFWSVSSTIMVLLIVFPSINIFMNLFKGANENWDHIKEYLLKTSMINTIILVIGTALLTVVIGVTLAWIVTIYDFPFKKFFKWGLILPLAIPPYIAAYTYDGMLNYTGVIQSALRNSFNITVQQKYFDITSIKGAIFIFTMFLFPYVFTITKAFFAKQSSNLIESARVLGNSTWEIFFKVALPISRTAIAGGVTLVVLEVLNDYGVVKYFGVTTFSTAIFKTWFSLGDIDSAIRLSALLMMFVIVVLTGEKVLRGRKQFSYTSSKIKPLNPIKLKGVKGGAAFTYCFIIFSLGFIIPTAQLIHWFSLSYEKILTMKFLILIKNTVIVGIIASVLIIMIATIVANFSRISRGGLARICSRVITLGYSIPGSVISIGVISFFILIDNKMSWLYEMIDKGGGKLVLTTSLAMLIFAYIIRFLAVGFNTVEAGFEKVGKKYFEASRMLGMNVTQTFFKVDFKMIRPAILSGFLLVFIDILKELPLTLILRPFNFETLATKTFEYANDEMIHEAAIASIFIIIIGVIAVFLFYRTEKDEVR
ncbi:iron ABC transporter permease [Oceanirhabdus seepicola]|uniref:Iron ABC transporter permease n=2 Tax=Oceanirhabdus seepicola TaxID=2828781 RepID=A0A9J6P432_9CLOT|nr:iron ABC transporter permease [Oceanirhabdus seepicola]MCM1991463.1 iron ABC transporter permease [Oceanirhabdus seepicola]